MPDRLAHVLAAGIAHRLAHPCTDASRTLPLVMVMRRDDDPLLTRDVSDQAPDSDDPKATRNPESLPEALSNVVVATRECFSAQYRACRSTCEFGVAQANCMAACCCVPAQAARACFTCKF